MLEIVGHVFRVFGTAILALVFIGSIAVAVISAGVLTGAFPAGEDVDFRTVGMTLASSLVTCALCPLLIWYVHRFSHRIGDHIRQSVDTDGPDEPVAEASRTTGPRLCIAGHLALQFAVAILGLLTAFVLFFTLVLRFQHHPFLNFLAFGLIMSAGWELPRVLVRLLPARCERCGGPDYCCGRRPNIYVCRSCGHSGDTGVYEGN